MRRLTILLTILTFTGFMLAACGGDSGTGPDPDNNGDNGGNGGDETTTYTVEVSAADGGLVLPNGTNEYEEGEEIELEASANDGYVFSGWTGNTESTENPLSLTVDKDYSLKGNFEKKNYTLITKTEGEGAIDETVIERKETDYEHGTVVELTANPGDGYKFIEWEGDLSGNRNPAQIIVASPKEITAIFKQFYLASNGVTIKCEGASVGDTGTVDGTEYTKRSADQITPDNAPNTCTSDITDMSGMFDSDNDFNGDISHWDVSSVTNMHEMFRYADTFNGDISSWDVSSVTDMKNMFYGANSFNQDIGTWDVSNVKNMYGMFWSASSFNQDIGNWDVSDVEDIRGMFVSANDFNSDISDWDISSVTSLSAMFNYASSFNQDLNDWDVSSVQNMASLFRGATNFNGDISGWDVSSVEDMGGMFEEAEAFKGDIGSWDVGKVTDMIGMFDFATSFNQDISGWCVTNISSEPTDFSKDSPLSESKKPEWGQCPGS